MAYFTDLFIIFSIFPFILINILNFKCIQSQELDKGGVGSFMNLITPKDIAELTQAATQIAAQTFRSNGELISNSGPEVRPVSLDSQPSEMFGQGLTNLMGPVRQSIASALTGQRVQQQPETRASLSNPQPLQGTTSGEDSNSNGGGRSLIEQLAGQFLGTSSARRDDEDTRSGGFRSNRGISTFVSTENSRGGNNLDGMVGQAMRLFSVDNGNKNNLITPSDDRRNSYSSSSSSKSVGVFPKLDQLFPGAQKILDLNREKKIAYGNCVKQADEKTWDTWGKEINNALTGGKFFQ
uniref:Uncharacterized protein n=1 Tax=Meloidogyne enterolobii TaxID=390850 RepID=A0A6V7V3N7_MELEN|nr:unnamed protein product [Meloidogyne enterolobii]